MQNSERSKIPINFKIPPKIKYLPDFDLVFTNYPEENEFYIFPIHIMFNSELWTGAINEISFNTPPLFFDQNSTK